MPCVEKLCCSHLLSFVTHALNVHHLCVATCAQSTWLCIALLYHYAINPKSQSGCLGGVMRSVLAFGPKVHGFKPGWSYGFLRTTEIHSALSVGGEAKLEAQNRKVLWSVKITSRYEQKYFTRPNSHSFHTLLLATSDNAGRIARELWWTCLELSTVIIIPPWFFMLIYNPGDE
jgi:hypothetical protein